MRANPFKPSVCLPLYPIHQSFGAPCFPSHSHAHRKPMTTDRAVSSFSDLKVFRLGHTSGRAGFSAYTRPSWRPGKKSLKTRGEASRMNCDSTWFSWETLSSADDPPVNWKTVLNGAED